MTEANLELLQTQARLARLLERDAKYAEAETLLNGIWDDPMPTAVRYEVGKTYARILRLRNKWDELDAFLTSFVATVEEDGDTEELAQLLVLRMEADLCAYPNNPAGCIDAADLLMSISQDSDLTFRALGHKGLACLALGDLAGARRWIDQGIAVAERSGDPYAVFLAWHFSSQFAIATLDLQTAVGIGQKLMGISDTNGIAREELFHLRDLGRAELLAGLAPNAAAHLCSFLLANKRSYERDRALTYLVLTINEAAGLTGRDNIEAFLDSLGYALTERSGDQSLLDLIARLSERARGGLELDPKDYVADPVAIEASWRIFCFNCDQLDQVRRSAVTASDAPAAEPGAARPVIVVDLHGALAYFRGSFSAWDADAPGDAITPEQADALRTLAASYDIVVTRGEA